MLVSRASLSAVALAVCAPALLVLQGSVGVSGAALGDVIGWVDGVFGPPGGQYIQGWACETNNPASISVHLYTTGPAGSGTFYGSFLADGAPGDAGVNAACNTPGSNVARRFYIPVTGDLFLRAGQTIYVHGISPDGGANNVLLGAGNHTVPTSTVWSSFDVSYASGFSGGWALDTLSGGTSIQVQFYADGPVGIGALIATTTGGDSRPDVNQVTGYPGDHGFNVQLSA